MIDFRRDCLGIGMPDIPGCPATSSGYVAQYQTVYDSFTSPPPDTVADAQNTMASSLVDAGIWAKLDLFYVFANNDRTNAVINWIAPGTHDASEQNGPITFTTYEGYTGNASNFFLKTSYNPGDGGSYNFTQNSACMGVYNRTYTAISNVSFGALDAGNSGIYADIETDRWYGRFNSTGLDAAADTMENGMCLASRIGAAGYSYYNNNQKYDLTEASVAVKNLEIYVMTYNANGVPGTPIKADHQMSCFVAGGGLIQSEVTILVNTFETYMDSNGKGVI